MPDGTAECAGDAASPPPLLRVVQDPGTTGGRMPRRRRRVGDTPGLELLAALDAADERAPGDRHPTRGRPGWSSSSFAELARNSRRRVRRLPMLRGPPRRRRPHCSSASSAFAVWAGAVDYPLRVTSDTPTFIALRLGHGGEAVRRRRARSSKAAPDPARDAVYAGPRLLWRGLASTRGSRRASSARFLALVGIAVFAFTLSASSSTPAAARDRRPPGCRFPSCSASSARRTSSGRPISRFTARCTRASSRRHWRSATCSSRCSHSNAVHAPRSLRPVRLRR